MIVFDANVLIYSMDDSNLVKHRLALEWFAAHLADPEPPALMWQVACETLAWLRKRESQGRLTSTQVESEARRILGAFLLIMPDPRVLDVSLPLKRRFKLSHWDSLLLGACIVAGVDTLYSEDMSHNGVYDSVTVINRSPPVERITSLRSLPC